MSRGHDRGDPDEMARVQHRGQRGQQKPRPRMPGDDRSDHAFGLRGNDFGVVLGEETGLSGGQVDGDHRVPAPSERPGQPVSARR
jgi:hypothetical protein